MKKFEGKHIIFSLFGIAAFLALVVASGTTADFSLPPRSDSTPEIVTISQGALPTGTRLQLNAHFSDSWPWDSMHWQDVWSEVEWEDSQKGEWFLVDGWKGNLDAIEQGENGWVATKEWWAADDIMGKGPLRWKVYDHNGGRLLAMSEPFYLADFTGGMVIVPVELSPPN